MAVPNIPNPPPGQQRPYPTPSISGKMPFSYPGTGPSTALKGETAYWIWGDLASKKPPLIVVHGGPGMSHIYMLPLSLISVDYGVPVIMYDQIGCGESTRFKDRVGDEDFWTVALFIEELDALTKHLQLERFDLLGHSWGGFLSGSLAIEKQPAGLRKLVIANSPSNLGDMPAATRGLVKLMPEEIQAAVAKCEAEDNFESPEGMAAMMYAYALHGCRVQPWPQELMQQMAALAEDNTVYKTMAGSSALTMKGSLMRQPGLDDHLAEITCPGGLLVVSSEFDMSPAETMTSWGTKPKCKIQRVHLQLSSHFSMLEETEELVKAVGHFLIGT